MSNAPQEGLPEITKYLQKVTFSFSGIKKNEIMLEVICFRNIWYSNEVTAAEIFKNYNFPMPELGLPAPIFIASKMIWWYYFKITEFFWFTTQALWFISLQSRAFSYPFSQVASVFREVHGASQQQLVGKWVHLVCELSSVLLKRNLFWHLLYL